MDVFKVGQLVWARMEGFPPWPGLISDPPEELKKHATKAKSCFCIYFFGTKNYGWIETGNLKHYEENKQNLMKSAKSSGFIAALKEIEDYRQGNTSVVVSPATDPFDLIIAQKTPSKKAKQTDSEKKEKSLSDDDSSKHADDSSSDESNTRNLKGNPVKSDMKSLTKQELRNDDVSCGHRQGKKRSNTNAENEDRTKKRKSGLNGVPTQEYSSSLDEQKRKESLSYPSTSYLPSASTSRAESPPTEDQSYSESQKKDIIPSELRFGFIGLGIMGSSIVKNLLKTGHQVTVWNRTTEKADIMRQIGAEVSDTPGEVVMASDITFCCVSDIAAAQQIVFGNCGVLVEMCAGKSLVEMTNIDTKTSTHISEGVISHGGRYLEVRLQGSRKEADEGSLLIMAAGDKSLYDDCETCFSAFGKHSTFLGDVGFASNANAIIQMISAVMLGSVAEGLALAEKGGISISVFIEILKHSHLNCQLVTDTLKTLYENNYDPNISDTHLKNGVAHALRLGDETNEPLFLGSAASQLFMRAKKRGHRHNDSAAVHLGIK